MDAAPVVAVSPSFPTDPAVVIEPDPVYPVLERGLRLEQARVGSPSFGVTVPFPKGWARTDTDLVESKWAPPGSPLNTYLLRVKIVSGLRLTIEQALAQRRTALESVVTEWDLENESDDTFTATYVNDEHRRLAIERFLSLDGTDNAFVTIAVIGRVADREGLSDLWPGSRRRAPALEAVGLDRVQHLVGSGPVRLRTCTQSRRFAATWLTRSTVTPPGQPLCSTVTDGFSPASVIGSAESSHSGC